MPTSGNVSNSDSSIPNQMLPVLTEAGAQGGVSDHAVVSDLNTSLDQAKPASQLENQIVNLMGYSQKISPSDFKINPQHPKLPPQVICSSQHDHAMTDLTSTSNVVELGTIPKLNNERTELNGCTTEIRQPKRNMIMLLIKCLP